jgi:prophage antirepressor-like protein
MSNVVPFNFGDISVRVVMQGGEPWWVASDVAQALEYRDASNMVRNLGEEENSSRVEHSKQFTIFQSAIAPRNSHRFCITLCIHYPEELNVQAVNQVTV